MRIIKKRKVDNTKVVNIVNNKLDSYSYIIDEYGKQIYLDTVKHEISKELNNIQND